MIEIKIDSHEIIDECDDLIEALENLPLDQIGGLMLEDVKSKTPVRTGFLRDNNYFYIDGSDVVVTNSADYAEFVNDGTRYMDAEEFMDAEESTETEIEDLLVRHLGD
jgi:hypothetical protein